MLHGATLALLALFALAPTARCMKVAIISDMHMDIYYGTSRAMVSHQPACSSPSAPRMGDFGCDSPPALVQSALNDVINVTRPAYIFVAGDWLRHKMAQQRDAAPETYQRIVNMLANYSGGVVPIPNVVTPLGNNDVVPDYYWPLNATAPPQLLTDMANMLRSGNLLTEAEHDTFRRYGYYARQMPGANLVVLVLNTLLWTFDLDPTPAVSDDPEGMFAFLEDALAAAAAAGKKVLILSHMPPTINFFEVQMHGLNTSNPDGWYYQGRYAARYFALLSRYNATVTNQMFAHTHRFSFSASATGVPLYIFGAVSPVYDNNPAYIVAELDETTGQFTRMQQRYLPIDRDGDVAAWTDGDVLPGAFDVPQATPAAPLSNAFMIGVADQVWTNATAFETWQRMYTAHKAWTCDTSCRQLAYCFINRVPIADVAACVSSTVGPLPTPTAPIAPPPAPTSSKAGATTAVVVIVVVFVAVGAAVAVFLWRRGRHDPEPYSELDEPQPQTQPRESHAI